MQTQKDDIKNEILYIAKKEFLEKGFYGSKVREISEKSYISTGNIYTYFNSKNDLFYAIVFPAYDLIQKNIALLRNYDLGSLKNMNSEDLKDLLHDHLTIFLNELNRYYDEAYILFLKSKGSNYENIKETIIEEITEISFCFKDYISENYKDQNVHLSDFFIHNLVSFIVNFFLEMIMHKKEIENSKTYLLELIDFLFFGISNNISISNIKRCCL